MHLSIGDSRGLQTIKRRQIFSGHNHNSEAVRRRGIAGDDDLLKLKNSISLVIGTAGVETVNTLNIAARLSGKQWT